mgnify:CR=1 FL=1
MKQLLNQNIMEAHLVALAALVEVLAVLEEVLAEEEILVLLAENLSNGQ